MIKRSVTTPANMAENERDPPIYTGRTVHLFILLAATVCLYVLIRTRSILSNIFLSAQQSVTDDDGSGGTSAEATSSTEPANPTIQSRAITTVTQATPTPGPSVPVSVRRLHFQWHSKRSELVTVFCDVTSPPIPL